MHGRNWSSLKFLAAFMSAVQLANWGIPRIATATVKRYQSLALFRVICPSTGLIKTELIHYDLNRNQSAPALSQQEVVHCPLCVGVGALILPSQHFSFFALYFFI
jgi:hypothetical protein